MGRKVSRHPSEECNSSPVRVDSCSSVHQGLLSPGARTRLQKLDSQVVLGYIRNDARRFHVFVANRVQQIRDSSSPSQWQYVRTEENPADEASRGVFPRNLVNNSHWLKGPPFLWEQTIKYQDEEEATFALSPDDPELKKTRVLATSGTQREKRLRS